MTNNMEKKERKKLHKPVIFVIFSVLLLLFSQLHAAYNYEQPLGNPWEGYNSKLLSSQKKKHCNPN